MQKSLKIVLLCAVGVLAGMLLTACHRSERQAKHLQHTLTRQQERAQVLTRQLADALVLQNSFDSVWALTQRHDDVLFYVFDHERLLYWSDNWLAAENVALTDYDRWWYGRASNAHIVGRWTRAETYNILTLLPIKYAYPSYGGRLENQFIAPFHADSRWQVTRYRSDDSYPLFSQDGAYLFSVQWQDSVAAELSQAESLLAERQQGEQTLEQTFSYRNLLTPDEGRGLWSTKNVQLRIFYMVFLAFFLLLLGVGAYILIAGRGFSNMRLRTKILYPMIALIFFVFTYVFFTSVRYMRQTYEARRRIGLQYRTRYIQSALQNLYYWDAGLTSAHTSGLNIDLRDLSFTYQSDIHVYDLRGNLVGSSVPFLFSQGVLSTHIAPEAFFSDSSSVVLSAQLAGRHYLVAYEPFYNGALVPIGYIAVPQSISSDEVNADLDTFLGHLLPPYLIGLVLAILISWFISRALTAPLASLSEKMRSFRLGRHDSHIRYDKQDEIGELVRHYNQMVDQLEQSTASLARAERETAWRTMARQIAHEINNPLTPMKLRIQQLRRLRDENDPRFEDYFQNTADLLVQQIDDLSRIASSFSTFAKLPEVRATDVDVASRLLAVITLFRSNPDNIPIRYIGPDSGVFARADADQLPEVFTNILKNAMQALANRPDGDIIVILKRVQDDDGDWVLVSFSDNGPGIPEEVQPHIFTPDFTTKSTGTGLGLAISRNIVEGAGGKISFTTSDSGTTFSVYLRCPV